MHSWTSGSGVVSLLLLCLSIVPSLSALRAADADDLEALRRRVAALEAQNGAMRAQLDALAARLGPPPAATAAPASSPPPPEVRAGESRVDFYGLVRVDAIYDDSRPNAFQSPLFIQSEGGATGLRDNENLTMHPRLTRFGMNYNVPRVPQLRDAALSGRIEIDFQNGGRESRGIPRYRHLFLQSTWTNSSLLLGQTADVIAPLLPNANADTTMWNTGNIGDRRAQVRYRRTSGRMTFETAAGLTGAVDALDLDADGVIDGEASALPNVQARIGVDSAAKDRWAIGLWAARGWQKTNRTVGGATRFDSSIFGIDYRAALGRRARIQGEAWAGEGMADFRGGAGQSINTATGDTIGGRGGWIELGFDAAPRSTIFAGYAMDDPDDGDVPNGGRIENGAWYLAHRLRFGSPFTLGMEYLRWTTRYRGLPDGTDNRLDLYAIYNF